MNLKDKAKEDFTIWMIQNVPIEQLGIWSAHTLWFDTLLPSMKYGLYVEYFDTVGININVGGKIGGSWNLLFCIEIWDNNEEWSYYDNRYSTRPIAQKEAIKEANKIYNKRYGDNIK